MHTQSYHLIVSITLSLSLMLNVWYIMEQSLLLSYRILHKIIHTVSVWVRCDLTKIYRNLAQRVNERESKVCAFLFHSIWWCEHFYFISHVIVCDFCETLSCAPLKSVCRALCALSVYVPSCLCVQELHCLFVRQSKQIRNLHFKEATKKLNLFAPIKTIDRKVEKGLICMTSNQSCFKFVIV